MKAVVRITKARLKPLSSQLLWWLFRKAHPFGIDRSMSASSVLHEATGSQVNGDVRSGRTISLSQVITIPSY